MTKLSPDFSVAMRDIGQGLLLKPILTSYLYDARFPDFSIHFRKHDMNRRPDGWFHPSEHPLWDERQLFWYLTKPELMVPEIKEYMGTLAVTLGTAMHGFVQTCIGPRGAGVLVAEEVGVADVEVGSRGNMDGILELPQRSQDVFEFKTSNPMKLNKVTDNDLDIYRAKWPEYYAQNQEYMRMSGITSTVVLFMSLSYPFTMKEFLVPYDEIFAMRVRNKYRRVRQAVADQAEPDPCCGLRSVRSKNCPARETCVVGRMSR